MDLRSSLESVTESDYFHYSSSQESDSHSVLLKSNETFKKEDFEILCNIGKGKFSKVLKAKSKKNGKIYAIKIIERMLIEKVGVIHKIYIENQILHIIEHPNIIKIFGIFEENSKIYIVMENLPCGLFSEFLKNNTPLPIETAKFFTAQIVSCLEYLHSKNIAHRDINPENMLLDENMHIRLINFYSAKLKGKEFDTRSFTFIDCVNECFDEDHNNERLEDNLEYITTEILQNSNYGPMADLWALGCMIYYMFTGTSPLLDKNEYRLFMKILEGKSISRNSIPADAIDLIKSLVCLDKHVQLGSGKKGSKNDYVALMNHCFFNGIDFKKIESLELPNQCDLKIKIKIRSERGVVNQSNNNSLNQSKATKILKEGLVKKKSPWLHYNLRKLVLQSDFRLEYFEPNSNNLRGVIYLSKECFATSESNNRFSISTPKRIFIFKTEENDALTWSNSINELIKLI